MQKVTPIKETLLAWFYVLSAIFVIACSWAVVVLISWTFYLMWKWLFS